jgi:hypothetical protein
MIPKSGYRFSETIMLKCIKHTENRIAIVLTIAAAALPAAQIRRAKCPR